MKKKITFNLIATFFYLLSINHLKADFRIDMLEKYKMINTLSFEFTQTIGEKIEIGDCYIKYPLLMKCEYPKKKKIIITNGRKLAIIKKRYNKIHQYPLKKTPLYYLLKKENILNIIKNYEPTIITSKEIEYEIIDENSNSICINSNDYISQSSESNYLISINVIYLYQMINNRMIAYCFLM